MNELVIFDVDGTILKGQSQKLFLNYMFKEKYISLFGFIKLNLWFIFYKLDFIKNPLPAINYAYSFLKGKSISEIENLINNFFNSILKKYIFKEVIEIINDHLKNGRKVILVSNSVDILIKKIAEYLNVSDFISTKLEVQNDRYTGKIIGSMMYGENKIKAVEQYAQKNNISLNNSWSYADHYSDIPLLLKTTYVFVVNPSKKLQQIATEKNWQVLQFNI
ncbi:MAG: HAD-IB family hydrolase [Parcubacteria group bacterium]|nr:HAD-IB family hydrolase [Parcubacteria group bacterium]